MHADNNLELMEGVCDALLLFTTGKLYRNAMIMGMRMQKYLHASTPLLQTAIDSAKLDHICQGLQVLKPQALQSNET